MVGSQVFLVKLEHQFIYPNEENEYIVANEEKKKDYCVNPCLSQLINEL